MPDRGYGGASNTAYSYSYVPSRVRLARLHTVDDLTTVSYKFTAQTKGERSRSFSLLSDDNIAEAGATCVNPLHLGPHKHTSIPCFLDWLDHRALSLQRRRGSKTYEPLIEGVFDSSQRAARALE